MKKTFVFLTMAALFIGAMSCSKNAVAPEVKQPESLANGALTIQIGMSEEDTKAALSSMKDYRINNVQVFVFDADNRLETDVFKEGLSTDDPTQVTINTKTGAKTVYALVNNERLYLTTGSAGQTLASFEATLTDLGQNGSETDLVMSGKNSVNVVDFNNNGLGGTPQLVNIYVKRLAARIQLDGVTVKFSESSLSGATFTVERVYLKNVVGKSPIGVTGLTGSASSAVTPIALPASQYDVAENWYNKMTETGTVPSVIYDSFSQVCNVAGTKTNLNRILFTFPNSTDGDSNSDTWGKRHTRIVIKAHVTKAAVSIDKDTYYVLDLPILAANTVYEIDNINITMLGKDNDDDDSGIRVGKETYTITVDPWTGTTHLNYEF